MRRSTAIDSLGRLLTFRDLLIDMVAKDAYVSLVNLPDLDS